ncbi:uncharacterized protein LOC129796664 [Lutzomyia longipalpis]|uniref:uncharacterized protein LOC129796664 n=1 Tax=Lutzomyia longipalpis TaxID=7200 RepID=UPI002484308E|nr:uncharacterized protein LOC129796664 [Lutzomyia longipalpis]
MNFFLMDELVSFVLRKRSNRTTQRPKATIFNIPVEDVFIPLIAPHLRIVDIMNFGACSRQCQEIATQMMAKYESIHKDSRRPEGRWNVERAINCTNLREISLWFERSLTDELFTELIKNNPKVHTVKLIKCKRITPKGLNALLRARHLRTLELMNINCDDEFLIKLADCNRKLTNLRLSCNFQMTTNTLVTFFMNQPRLEYVMLRNEGYVSLKEIVQTIVETARNSLRIIMIKDPAKTLGKTVLESASLTCPNMIFYLYESHALKEISKGILANRPVNDEDDIFWMNGINNYGTCFQLILNSDRLAQRRAAAIRRLQLNPNLETIRDNRRLMYPPSRDLRSLYEECRCIIQ